MVSARNIMQILSGLTNPTSNWSVTETSDKTNDQRIDRFLDFNP